MNILNVIIGDCARVLTNEPEQERELVDFIKAEIERGTWTPQTHCLITSGGETIDQGMIGDFFNLD